MIELEKFYQEWFKDKTHEGIIRLHYTTLSMVSNLFEILKAMQVKSNEEVFGAVFEEMKKDDMRTFIKLVSSLLNPSTELAWSHVEYALNYIIKEYKAN